MKLDYDRMDTRTEEKLGEYCLSSPEEERPRKLYRQHCTWRELSILDRECSVDGIPWAMGGDDDEGHGIVTDELEGDNDI